ncbi:MAG: hypothetical protein AAB515_01170 [Patescibacteria group bacterium]
MATTPAASTHTPQQKAIIGTAVVLALLLVFGFVGYWYGKKGADVTKTATTNTNTNAASTENATPGQKTVFAGKVTKVLGQAIEVSSGSGDTTQTITAKIADATVFRKLDLRTIPKNGVGDGTSISFAEFKVGNQVVVASADTSASTVTASKISLVIYP